MRMHRSRRQKYHLSQDNQLNQFLGISHLEMSHIESFYVLPFFFLFLFCLVKCQDKNELCSKSQRERERPEGLPWGNAQENPPEVGMSHLHILFPVLQSLQLSIFCINSHQKNRNKIKTRNSEHEISFNYRSIKTLTLTLTLKSTKWQKLKTNPEEKRKKDRTFGYYRWLCAWNQLEDYAATLLAPFGVYCLQFCSVPNFIPRSKNS